MTLRKRPTQAAQDKPSLAGAPIDLSSAMTRHTMIEKLQMISASRKDNDLAHVLATARGMLPSSEMELIAEAGALLARNDLSIGRGDGTAFAPPDLSAPVGRQARKKMKKEMIVEDVHELQGPQTPGAHPGVGLEVIRGSAPDLSRNTMTTRGSTDSQKINSEPTDMDTGSHASIQDQTRSGKKRVRVFKHKITDETRLVVKYYAFAGHKQEEIAAAMGVSLDTLQRHYRYELDHATQEIGARLAHRLVSIALHGHGKEAVTALIFLLKSRVGFREEPTKHEFDITVGGTIQHEHYALTHEERANRVLQIIAGGGPQATRLLDLKRPRDLEAQPGDADGSLPLPS